MTSTRSTLTATDLAGDLTKQVQAAKNPSRRANPPSEEGDVAPGDGPARAGDEAFTEAEVVRLAELEAIIDASVLALGSALLEIRDSRLYRKTHKRFEDYVAERFGFSRSWPYRQIEAAPVLALASPMGDITTERQARELIPLLDDPEKMRHVIEAASVDGRPTAARLRQERKKLTNDAATTVPETNARRRLIRVEELSEYVEFDLPAFLADPDVVNLRDASGLATVKLYNRRRQIETCIESDLGLAAEQRREAASEKRETARQLCEEAGLDDSDAETIDAVATKLRPVFEKAAATKAARRAPTPKTARAKRSS